MSDETALFELYHHFHQIKMKGFNNMPEIKFELIKTPFYEKFFILFTYALLFLLNVLIVVCLIYFISFYIHY